MKYRLKKDLPFAKAGQIVYIDAEEGSKIIFDENYITICGRRSLEKLLTDGWIEEVQPREWWLIPNSVPIFEPYAVRTTDVDVSEFKNVIKVREVIE